MSATTATAIQLPNIRITGVVAMGALGELLEGEYVAGAAAGTRVALKRLNDRPLGERGINALRRKAERMLGREHRNLLKTHALVASAGNAYLVVDRLDGIDVADVRRATTAVPEWVAVAIATQVLAGLSHAANGSYGIALRGTLGPAHVFVCRSGEVKLLDCVDTPPEAATWHTTSSGESRAFVSPEQAACERLDERSDLFQLAAVVYFLLTGASPRDADGQLVPIERRCSNLSAPLAQWFGKALALARKDRYQSAAEMLAALVEAVEVAPDEQLASWLGELPTSSQDRSRSSADPKLEVVASGAHLGRYIVEEQLAEGGMGVVYLAYDPELDRKIALKLMHPQHARDGQERLLREAQSMAKIAHPNTVAVYDVGLIGGRVFLAMELVRGVTLAEWLRSDRRSWRDVVAVMREAGRGLAAAHDVGLVHRDFKPENVLIGNDGRTRVTDFGLARRALAEPGGAASERAPAGSMTRGGAASERAPAGSMTRGGAASERAPAGSMTRGDNAEPGAAGEVFDPTDGVTRRGTILGTPAYMAPEQRRGHLPDVRTDQFSFGVTLYQALHGRRPADPPDPAHERQVPRWIAAVVKRATSERPEDRYPSMQALLAELSRDPTAAVRRGVVWTAGAVAVVLPAALLMRSYGRADVPLCTGSEERLRGAWDADLKSRVKTSFLASDRPFAAEAWERTSATLDAYARDWVAMHHDTCTATRVRGDQSESVMALRTLCLDRAAAQLKALTTVLATADADMIERAPVAASRLPRLSECADVALLTRDRDEPATAVERERLAQATAKLARIEALYETGRYAAGMVAADALDRELGDALPRTKAELAYRRGELAFARGQVDASAIAYEQAVLAAERGAYPLYVARAYGRLTAVAACAQHNAANADRYSKHTQAVMAAIGGDALAETWRLLGSACLRDHTNDVAGSAADTERALAVYTKVYGRDPVYAQLLTTFGASLSRDRPRGLRAIDDAIAIEESLLGGHHPKLVYPLIARSLVLNTLGRYDEANASARRALAIREAIVKGPDRLVAAAHLSIARTLLDQHDLTHAEEAARLAVDMRTAAIGKGTLEVIDADVMLAEIMTERGNAAAAVPMLEADLQQLTKLDSGTESTAIDTRLALGAAYRKLGRLPDATAAIELALAAAQQRDDRLQTALCQFGLAEALAANPRNLERAHQLAIDARQYFTDVPNPAKATEIERWLAAH